MPLNSIHPEASSLWSKLLKHFHQNKRTDQLIADSTSTNVKVREASQTIDPSFHLELDNVPADEQRELCTVVSVRLDEKDFEMN